MRRIVYFNITYQCNNCCRNCISHNVRRHSAKKVSVEDYKIIQNRFGIGENDIWTISGGEPTLSQNFEEIISFCRKYSSHITVYSNGRMLYNLSLNTLNNIERIIVPIYGIEYEHNKYVQNNRAYGETLESLNKIIKYSPHKIEMKLMLSESISNIEDLIESKDWEVISPNIHFSVSGFFQKIILYHRKP